jgi:hypothetical protein
VKDDKKKSDHYHFVEKRSLSEDDVLHLKNTVQKDFPVAIWNELGVKIGELHYTKKGQIDNFVLGFPLPVVGWKVYRPHISDKERRWLFADGGKASLLGEIGGDSVMIVEGEWDLMSALDNGISSVVTGTNGAGTFKKEWELIFKDKHVVIIYDVNDLKKVEDEPIGQYYAKKLTARLTGTAETVKNVVLPLDKIGGDLTDYFESGKTQEDLERLIEETPVFSNDYQQSFDWSKPQEKVDIDQVRRIILEQFGEIVWDMTEVALTVANTLLFKDVVNPKGIIFEGVPSSQKTTVFGFLEGLDEIVYLCDSFTPKSFVSHAAKVKREMLKNIDLLPRIKHKLLLIPEMAPVFGKRHEDLLENLSILTRVFDGRGLSTDSGIQGRRSLTGDYYFAMLAATTPIEWRVWKLMGKLGSRLLVYAVPEENETVDSLLRDIKTSDPYVKRCQVCKEVIHKFLRYMWHIHGGPRKVDWDNSKDENKLFEMIAQVARFSTTARSIVSVWKDGDDEKYSYRRPVIEGKKRMTTLLYDLAKSHALTFGRDCINVDDVTFVIQLGLMSMPEDRRLACRLLLSETETPKGTVTATEIESGLGISTNTAKSLMMTLQVLGIGRLETDPYYKLILSEEYEWFLGDDFEQFYLRQKIDGVKEKESKGESEEMLERHDWIEAHESLPF